MSPEARPRVVLTDWSGRPPYSGCSSLGQAGPERREQKAELTFPVHLSHLTSPKTHAPGQGQGSGHGTGPVSGGAVVRCSGARCGAALGCGAVLWLPLELELAWPPGLG